MQETSLSGSCLCGAVRYVAHGSPMQFYHCHCRRCRKATGTGHASNLFLKGTLTWQSGDDRVVSFKLPEAARFVNTFCRDCGARLPRFIEKIGMVMIPAGSLDDDPAIAPQARIFTDSRAPWSCDDTALPGFTAYPS